MFVPVCDRPSVAEPTEAQDRAGYGDKERCNSPKNAACWHASSPLLDLPIRQLMGDRPLPAATGTVQSARAWRAPSGSRRVRPSCCPCRTSTSSSPCRRRSAEIAFQNKRVVYAILFQAAAEALRDHRRRPQAPGRRDRRRSPCCTPGGRPCTHHPHLHCIVPGGGLSPDQTRWIACRPGFFLPVRVLSRLFRTLFLARLQAAFTAGELRFFGTLAAFADSGAFAGRLDTLRAAECRVGGDVAIPTPHRPGRADFPHPVLHERDLLAAA